MMLVKPQEENKAKTLEAEQDENIGQDQSQ